MNRIPIEQKLADLPTTANEIAIFLAGLGIQGRRGNSYKCPLANYLGGGVAIKPDKIIIDTDQWKYLPVPEPVAEFISKFDAGEYLELVELAAPTPF